MKKVILSILLMTITMKSFAPYFPDGGKEKKESIKEGFINQIENLLIKEEKSEFKDFLNAIAYNESRMITDTVNHIGAMGKYQFIQNTLHFLNFDSITVKKFKENPDVFPVKMQDKAMIKLLSINEKILQKEIKKYSHTVQNGVFITKSGILAAAHLAGAYGVKKYLQTKSLYNPTDLYGTSIKDYLKKFSGYNLDFYLYKPLKFN